MGHEQLSSAKYLSFATFRKNGKSVATPVWFAMSAKVDGRCGKIDVGRVCQPQ